MQLNIKTTSRIHKVASVTDPKIAINQTIKQGHTVREKPVGKTSSKTVP